MPAPEREIAEVTPALAPSVAPAADPLDWIVAHRDAWPKRVTLVKAVEFPIIYAGRTAGKVQAPPGTAVAVTGISRETLDAIYLQGGARVPVDSTDLRPFAVAQMAKADVPTASPLASLTPPQPAPTVTAAPAARPPPPWPLTLLPRCPRRQPPRLIQRPPCPLPRPLRPRPRPQPAGSGEDGPPPANPFGRPVD